MLGVLLKAHGGVVTVNDKIDSLAIAGVTACQFGRSGNDKQILYLTTTGALVGPINSTEVEGGKVVAIDDSKFDN